MIHIPEFPETSLKRLFTMLQGVYNHFQTRQETGGSKSTSPLADFVHEYSQQIVFRITRSSDLRSQQWNYNVGTQLLLVHLQEVW